MRPNILVLYFTQTGQLLEIAKSAVSEINNSCNITYAPILPVKAFPFPWTALTFFDAMPETVLHQPGPVHQLPSDVVNGQFDLVILCFQPWFLNPSQPMTAFLQSESGKVLRGKNVVTLIGSRNMWLHAQEKVKSYLSILDAQLVGNIVLRDTNPNLVSLLTVIRWSFQGKKEASGWLPAAGVQQKEITNAKIFGPIIERHLLNNSLASLHNELLNAGAVNLNPGLIVLEKRGIKNFRKWAKFIAEKGGPAAPERAWRVNLFKNLLLTAIFMLSPISSLTAAIQLAVHRSQLRKDVEYYKGLHYEPNKL